MWYAVVLYLLVGFGLWCWLERGEVSAPEAPDDVQRWARVLVVTSLWPVVLLLLAWAAWAQRAQRARVQQLAGEDSLCTTSLSRTVS